MAQKIEKLASDFHWLRRIWHFAGVMAMVILYFFLSKDLALFAALVVSGLLVPLDFIRLLIPGLNKKLILIFGPFLRTHETHRLTAASYMLIGVTISIALFPKNVVLLSLMMLALADPLAAIVGIRFGKDRIIGKKTLQGSIAAFLICTVLAFCYYSFYKIFPSDRLLLTAVLSGTAGAFAELIPVYKWDDNLTFPIISSGLIYGLFFLFGAI